MPVLRATRPFPFRAAIVALAVLATGCAKSSTKPATPVLSQEEADDLALQMCVTMASNGGGWLYLLQSTTLAVPRGGPGGPALALASSHPGGDVLLRDSSFTRATMTFQVNYLYTDTLANDSLAVWDPSVIEVDLESVAQGTVENPNFNVALMSVASIEGIQFDAQSDTVVFNGTTEDSLAGTMIPILRGGGLHFDTSVFSDLVDVAVADDASGSPWPRSGEAEFIIFADRLTGPPPSPTSASFEALGRITFDGTQTPRLLVSPDFDDPAAPIYRYRVNLGTGAITRD